ncbi:MAG: extracellular solute-binding protein, partial [Clostridiales bacterium]|nr:extracellular solute-binding protein [Clostridiales bacterium]
RTIYTSAAEHPVVQEIERQTGLKLRFVHPPENDDGSFFTTMIASGDYPDLIMNDFAKYPGGPDGAIEDGVIINANDLIYQYAPNYLTLLENEGEEVKKRVMSDDGTIIRFGTIFQPPFLNGRIHGGLVVRRDLLNQAGIEQLPVTIEEYDAMFAAFKDMGIQEPLALIRPDGFEWNWNNVFASAYGVMHRDFFQVEDKVTHGFIEPAYKEYLAKLNEWYTNGYFSSDFSNSSIDDAMKSYKSGRSAVAMCGSWQIVTMQRVAEEGNKNADTIGLPYMREEKETDLHLVTNRLLSVDGRTWFVSSTCQNPVEAVRLIDYLHMPETNKMCAWGVNNEEVTLWTEDESGNRQFTDFMLNNPDFDFGIARDRYTVNAFQVMWDEEMEIQQYDIPIVRESWENWSYKSDDINIMPMWVTHTADESLELSELMTPINTYADEMITKFIIGTEPLENFESFVEQLKKMGIDRAIEIKQLGYDRFSARQ